MNSICFNGKIMPADDAALLVLIGIRYGDGLFETIKVMDGTILLERFHFKGLFSGCPC
jgi:branched-chain amino acid aminotransferase